jgi:hypothetical protein
MGAFPKKENAVQVGVGRERFVCYGGDAVGDGDGGQPRALVERIIGDFQQLNWSKKGINDE